MTPITTQTITNELQKIGFPTTHDNIQLIREKFGITVFRLRIAEKSYVGKHYTNQNDRLEIMYYEILKSIVVPTIKMIAHTDCLLLMEDIETSDVYRLGTEEDISDPKVVRLLARWYKLLHTNGRKYDRLSKLSSINADELTYTNIQNVMNKSNSRDNPLWQLLIPNLDSIRDAYSRMCDTVVYNDFWWDNFVVARDYSSAMMVNYNSMWREYAYADIRNVLKVLPEATSAVFLEEYGPYDKKAKIYDDVVAYLTGLITAFDMDTFPAWADDLLEMLHNGELRRRFEALVLQLGLS